MVFKNPSFFKNFFNFFLKPFNISKYLDFRFVICYIIYNKKINFSLAYLEVYLMKKTGARIQNITIIFNRQIG